MSMEAELVELIGETATIALAEYFGGTRLYVPKSPTENGPLLMALGPRATAKLIERYSPDTITVPLMRALRAGEYRAQGYSYARIAVRLGVTESAVFKLFRRRGDTE